MKCILISLTFIIPTLFFAQNNSTDDGKAEKANELLVKQRLAEEASVKPKLVVGIVVDQMRNDFIYRYWNR